MSAFNFYATTVITVLFLLMNSLVMLVTRGYKGTKDRGWYLVGLSTMMVAMVSMCVMDYYEMHGVCHSWADFVFLATFPVVLYFYFFKFGNFRREVLYKSCNCKRCAARRKESEQYS